VDSNCKMQRLFLIHIWASAPFALVWAIWPKTVGASYTPLEITQGRIVLASVILYFLVRTWVVLHRENRWDSVWPIADVALITAAVFTKHSPDRTWLTLLYLIPITEAAVTLSRTWALSIAFLSIACFFGVTGAAGIHSLQRASNAFRLFFLILMASLIASLGKELTRMHRDIAVSQYRNKLAAEMHDGVQQDLAAMVSRLDYAQRLLISQPAEAARLAIEQRQLARQAADELRVMVWRLYSSPLAGESITDTMKYYVSMLRDRFPLDISLNITGEAPVLRPRVEHALFRIIQEALANALKHGRATKVRVSLVFGAEVCCSVEDNGVGFDAKTLPPEPGPFSGFGMHTMKQRAAEIGVDLIIESAAGSGTTVKVVAPKGCVA